MEVRCTCVVHRTCRRAGWRGWLVPGMNGCTGRATPQKRGTQYQLPICRAQIWITTPNSHSIHHTPLQFALLRDGSSRCTKARPGANPMPHLAWLAWAAWQSHAACQRTKTEPFHTGRHATLNYRAHPLPLAHSFLLSWMWAGPGPYDGYARQRERGLRRSNWLLVCVVFRRPRLPVTHGVIRLLPTAPTAIVQQAALSPSGVGGSICWVGSPRLK
jgi:hypothetical protein